MSQETKYDLLYIAVVALGIGLLMVGGRSQDGKSGYVGRYGYTPAPSNRKGAK